MTSDSSCRLVVFEETSAWCSALILLESISHQSRSTYEYYYWKTKKKAFFPMASSLIQHRIWLGPLGNKATERNRIPSFALFSRTFKREEGKQKRRKRRKTAKELPSDTKSRRLVKSIQCHWFGGKTTAVLLSGSLFWCENGEEDERNPEAGNTDRSQPR